MSMTPDQFRKIALKLHGVVEQSHMKHPDFRILGKIFATLGSPDKEWAMVKLPKDRQMECVRDDPLTYKPASGAWGRSGCTHVRLKSLKASQARTLLTQAAEFVKQSVRKPPTKTPSSKPIPPLSSREKKLFEKVEKLCMSFPGAVKTITWNEPHYRINNKIFAGAGIEDGKPMFGFKLEKDHAGSLIQLPGIRPAKYVGKHGWVAVDLFIVQDWTWLRELVDESYRLISGCD